MRITAGRVGMALGALAVVAGIAWFLMPKPIPVETATVTKGRFVASVDEDGKTRVRQRYVVAAPLAGRLTRVRLKAGDQVAADEIVAAILPPPAPLLDPRSRREAEERLGTAEAALERAKAVVERARAQTDNAKAELDRTRTLAGSGASTVQALERAELAQRVADRDLRAAEFQNHAAEHELAQATALLGRYKEGVDAPADPWNVSAPVSGVVLRVLQESETAVQSGTPLMEIGDPRDLEIVTDVLSTEAVEIRPGAEVRSNAGAARASRGTRTPDRTCGLHQGVDARRRGAAGQCADRHCIAAAAMERPWGRISVDTRITVFTRTTSRSSRRAPCSAAATAGASTSPSMAAPSSDPSIWCAARAALPQSGTVSRPASA